MSEIKKDSFFASSLTRKNRFQDFRTFKAWLAEQCRPEEFKVEQVPLRQLEKWHIAEDGSRIYHESGRFFSIEGLHVKTNFGSDNVWEQPIINQPEIGFLGFITRVFDGTRYFLMQAKMEPGNINTLQISPSLQATKSNFTQVHKGKRPTFLEYFNGEKPVKILSDNLQTEQGGRFYQKRNRNIVIEINEDITLPDEFCWLTLGELKALLREDIILNMDTRSVISTIPLIEDEVVAQLHSADLTEIEKQLSPNGRKFLQSYITKNSLHSIDSLLSWYTQQKTRWEMEVTKKPLCELSGWHIGEMALESDARYFSVIGVKVTAGTREVTSWMQPLIKDSNIGLLAFVCQKINGMLHFLVQAKVEPGNMDIIELSPTVSCSNYAFVQQREQRPFLFDEVMDKDANVLFDSLQSEEGGRFYQIQNRNRIVELPEEIHIDLPFNYTWMTLAQMKEFMRYGMFNIEARSIISAISFID